MEKSDAKHCADCGAVLPAYWPTALCAGCALGGAIALGQSDSAAAVALDTPTEPEQLSALPSLGAAGTRVGDYDLLVKIAHGGMGVVYRARQISLDRIVAVKMILGGAHASREFVPRFLAE